GDAGGGKLGEHLVEVVDAQVDHGLLRTGTEVCGVEGEVGEDGHAGGAGAFEDDRGLIGGRDAEVFCVPGRQCFRVRRLEENASDSECTGHGQSSCRMSWSRLGLCLASRPVRGSLSTTRAGLGWPTRSRALALTAFVAVNLGGLRFVMARKSME